LAARKNVPIFSASSLRYAPEVVQFLAEPKHGKMLGATVLLPDD
jgi:virulence factor